MTVWIKRQRDVSLIVMIALAIVLVYSICGMLVLKNQAHDGYGGPSSHAVAPHL